MKNDLEELTKVMRSINILKVKMKHAHMLDRISLPNPCQKLTKSWALPYVECYSTIELMYNKF